MLYNIRPTTALIGFYIFSFMITTTIVLIIHATKIQKTKIKKAIVNTSHNNNSMIKNDQLPSQPQPPYQPSSIISNPYQQPGYLPPGTYIFTTSGPYGTNTPVPKIQQPSFQTTALNYEEMAKKSAALKKTSNDNDDTYLADAVVNTVPPSQSTPQNFYQFQTSGPKYKVGMGTCSNNIQAIQSNLTNTMAAF